MTILDSSPARWRRYYQRALAVMAIIAPLHAPHVGGLVMAGWIGAALSFHWLRGR